MVTSSPRSSERLAHAGQGALRARRGLTMIELVGVVAIVALLFTAIGLSLQDMTRADLKGESQKLASTMLALYNRSVTRNAYYRLVLDLDENVYYSELAEKRFFLSMKMEEDDEGPSFKEKDAEAQAAGEVQMLERAEGPAMHQASGQEVKDALIGRVKMPKGVRIGGLLTTHQNELRTEGKGYIYFFPSGYVEHSYLYMTDDKTVYTIVTQPLTGRVKVLRGEIEPPGDFHEIQDDD